jgi:hypothetical protein
MPGIANARAERALPFQLHGNQAYSGRGARPVSVLLRDCELHIACAPHVATTRTPRSKWSSTLNSCGR